MLSKKKEKKKKYSLKKKKKKKKKWKKEKINQPTKRSKQNDRGTKGSNKGFQFLRSFCSIISKSGTKQFCRDDDASRCGSFDKRDTTAHKNPSSSCSSLLLIFFHTVLSIYLYYPSVHDSSRKKNCPGRHVITALCTVIHKGCHEHSNTRVKLLRHSGDTLAS